VTRYNNNNNNQNIAYGAVIIVIHPVHAMNAEQRQTAADLWTKPTDLAIGPPIGC